ncbi:MAG: hypothetical protein DMD89_19350 [Candidatus Rokuibacteriota bacterium]|nr:MAG: hypothetical protein DMD89_19350 [Candidatus Rokubacteria bacterium]
MSALWCGFLCLAVCLGALPIAEAQQPIRIGATLSQTGSFATLGQNQLRGYQLCVKHANDRGGVLGRKIEFTADDDHGRDVEPIA